MKRLKLTNNSDETQISGLLSGDNIFEIPYFQRPYKWKGDRLRKLEADILNIVDGLTDSHFLGAIIIHGRRSNPSDPTRFEIIDGQQRLTTIFLYVCAAIKTLCRHKHHDEALALFQKYVALGRQTGVISNLKLHPCGEDRNQLNVVMADITSDPKLKEKLGTYLPQKLPESGTSGGAIRNNYRAAVRFMESQFRQAGIERIRAVYEALLDYISVVQIDIWDPTNGPKIFDALNSRQEPMTIGDLVRNDIFSRVAGESREEIERIDRDEWQPFYQKFNSNGKNFFEDYFFPFGLIHDPNVSKSEVYNFLKERWKKHPHPSNVISDLATYQDAFLDLVLGSNRQEHPKILASGLGKLTEFGTPSSTFPFLMRLSQAVKAEEMEASTAAEIVELIEAFLIRRALCGFEPTGLHAVFKRLWVDCKGDVSRDSVAAAIQAHATVVWPSDAQVRDAVETRPLYGATVCNYVIRQYDHAQGGDTPQDIPWVEHVLPRTLSPEWKNAFSDDEHKSLVDLFANLLPLSSKMNQELSNRKYELKRKRFLEDSMFKSTRLFAEKHLAWTADVLAQRGRELATWAVERWGN